MSLIADYGLILLVLACLFGFFTELERVGLARVEPVIAVHHVVCRVGKFLYEVIARRAAAEYRVDRLGGDLLLTQRARE